MHIAVLLKTINFERVHLLGLYPQLWLISINDTRKEFKDKNFFQPQ